MAPECWSAEALDFDTVLSGPFYKLFREHTTYILRTEVRMEAARSLKMLVITDQYIRFNNTPKQCKTSWSMSQSPIAFEACPPF